MYLIFFSIETQQDHTQEFPGVQSCEYISQNDMIKLSYSIESYHVAEYPSPAPHVNILPAWCD